jgi:ABC-type polysaccharide/polyol phosphate export permease
MTADSETLKSLRETVYEPPDPSFRPLNALLSASADISRSRFLIWRMFMRDFKAQFRQQILGYLWAILTPILGVASFVFMNYAGVLEPGDSGIPYPLYVFFGTSIWAALTNSMQHVGNGLQGQADLILKTNVPKIALAISTLANVVYNLLVNYLLIVLISLLFGAIPTLWFLLYPVMLLPLLLVGVGLGLILAVIGVVAKDATPMATKIMGLVMYVTPVIYVSTTVDSLALQALIHYNPLSHLVAAPRSLFYLGETPLWGDYALSASFAMAVLVLGVYFFYLLQDKVAERL